MRSSTANTELYVLKKQLKSFLSVETTQKESQESNAPTLIVIMNTFDLSSLRSNRPVKAGIYAQAAIKRGCCYFCEHLSENVLLRLPHRQFVFCFIFKCYPTFDVAGFIFNVDRSNACSLWIMELSPESIINALYIEAMNIIFQYFYRIPIVIMQQVY